MGHVTSHYVICVPFFYRRGLNFISCNSTYLAPSASPGTLPASLPASLLAKPSASLPASQTHTSQMSQDLRRSLLAKLDPRRTASDVTPSQPQPQPLPAGLPSWKDFFQQNERVDLDDRGFSFNTYFSLPTTPDDALRASSPIPVFVFHHGAGSSALSFAPLAKASFNRPT